MRGKRIGLMLGIMLTGLALVVGRVDAALLSFDFFLPDITSDATGVYSYTAATDSFISTATPLAITFDGVTSIPITGTDVSPRSYSVSFFVDAAGNFAGGVLGDDLVIRGNIDVNGDSVIDYAGDLIKGEVTNFGWLDTGTPIDLFDFTFDFTAGALSSFYSPGFKGGDKMTSEVSTFTGSFASNFSGTKTKHDTAPVPEPTSLLLLGSGLLGFTLLGRAKRKKLSA